MRGFITGVDVANTVKMVHTQRHVTFLLMEGTTDVTLLRKFIARDRCEVMPCHGRSNAMAAVEILDESGEAGFLALVDADWDRLYGRVPPSPNCVWSDGHDLVVDLLCSAALEHVLSELGSASKVHAFEGANGPVREALLAEAARLGHFRWHNDAESLGLRFAGLQIHGYTVDGGLGVNLVDIVRVVVQRSSSTAGPDDLHDRCCELAGGGHDVRQVVVGHDAVALLSGALRALLGSQNAQDVRPEVIERELRLAFDRDCLEQTQFFAKMRSWEVANPGWVVFAHTEHGSGEVVVTSGE